MYDEILWEISKGKLSILSNGLTSIGSIACKIIYGYSFRDVSMVESVKNSNTPTLILHSKIDKKCPYKMAEEIYKSIPHRDKELITYENSEHLFSFWYETEKYSEDVFKYIEKFIERKFE